MSTRTFQTVGSIATKAASGNATDNKTASGNADSGGDYHWIIRDGGKNSPLLSSFQSKMLSIWRGQLGQNDHDRQQHIENIKEQFVDVFLKFGDAKNGMTRKGIHKYLPISQYHWDVIEWLVKNGTLIKVSRKRGDGWLYYYYPVCAITEERAAELRAEHENRKG
jgi:hypothetical protein